MAPPTTRPRLASIDPTALAASVQAQLVEHIRRLAMAIDMTWIVRDPEGPGDLRWSIGALCEYAQTGRDAETRDPHVAAEFAHERVGDVLHALYSCAAESPFSVETEAIVGDADSDTEIGCVLAAAWARVRIDMEEVAPAIGVAALASIDVQHLRLLARQGELELAEGEIRAAEARRWLSGRGVAGFAGPAAKR